MRPDDPTEAPEEPDETLDEEALADLAEEVSEVSEGPRVRKPKLPEPHIAALLPDAAPEAQAEMIASANKAWREATEREAPTIERLVLAGVTRVDADAASGYLAVVTADETWRAFIDRERFFIVLALLTRRPVHALKESLSRLPGSVEPAGREAPA